MPEKKKKRLVPTGKREVPEKRKLGRPTLSPKTTQFSVRFDNKTLKILDEYCEEHGLTRPEGVREAVRKLKEN